MILCYVAGLGESLPLLSRERFRAAQLSRGQCWAGQLLSAALVLTQLCVLSTFLLCLAFVVSCAQASCQNYRWETGSCCLWSWGPCCSSESPLPGWLRAPATRHPWRVRTSPAQPWSLMLAASDPNLQAVPGGLCPLSPGLVQLTPYFLSLLSTVDFSVLIEPTEVPSGSSPFVPSATTPHPFSLLSCLLSSLEYRGHIQLFGSSLECITGAPLLNSCAICVSGRALQSSCSVVTDPLRRGTVLVRGPVTCRPGVLGLWSWPPALR